MQENKAANAVQKVEQQLQGNIWNYRVGTMTAKLHGMVSSISWQNSEIVNKLIKKLFLVCPKKGKN